MKIQETLFDWLRVRPEWQQDLARRLTSSTQLEGEAYAEALKMVRGAFDALGAAQQGPSPKALQLEDLPPDVAAPGQSPRLLSFGHLRGVGIAAVDQELRFSERGMTIVYGPNAAGKTTYVRGLKRVCRTVDRESAICGDVFSAPDANASGSSANIEYLVAGERRGQRIDLTAPADLGLGDISVFDSRCAELYIDERNVVAYVPSALLLLARLAATQDQMRNSLNTELQSLEAQGPSFPELQQSTATWNRVSNLVGTTDVKELTTFATLNELEWARQRELRTIIAATETKSARENAQAAQQDASYAEMLAGQLHELGSRISGPRVQVIRSCAAEDRRAREAVALAAREFEALPITGVGGEPWQRLWRAAREFNEQRGAGFPPGPDEHCPLCLQQIAADAAAQMAHFEQHVQSAVQREAVAAQQAMTQALERLQETHVTACRTPFLAGLKEREPELHEALERYLGDVGVQMQGLHDDPAGMEVLPILDDAVKQLEQWGSDRGKHATALLAAANPEREAELRAELAELDDREKLAARITDVTAWVAQLGRIASLRRAYTGLATNQITTKQRELSDAVVTEILGGNLKEELRNVRCEHLPVDLQPQTAIGKTQVALRLAGAHGAPTVSDILSEGEQRAVSLAFFLAEVGSSEHDGGVVVDDPVSSLDDERRTYIAKRLVAECSRRQVIVLTHDLHFLLDLVEQAQAAGADTLIQGMWRIGHEVGRIDDHPPFQAMKLKARIGVLDQEVAQWDKQAAPRDFDDAWHRVCDFYDRMRKTWERAVEERLFREVVQRLQREVKTLKLRDVAITAEQISAVTDGMTRCSYFVHDAPPGAGTNLPNRQQLAEDLAKLQEFERNTRS